MKIQYRVHGVSKSTTTAIAVVDGETVRATVPCLEVELDTVGERHGSQTLRFTGSSIEEAQKLFVKDAIIDGGFTPAA